METVLQIKNACKQFGSTKALDNVCLELRRGEWLGLLGPNGAGKTTLIRAISGRVRLDKGSVEVIGSEPERMGIVPQEIALYSKLTTIENIQCFGRLMGLNGQELKETVKWALEFTGLKERANDLVGTFSGGMKRRLNIACSVLHRPSIILLDEPTVGVDPQSRQRIWEMLEHLRRTGASLMLTTHQLDEAQQNCDRIVVIDHGQIIANGSFDELVRGTVGSEKTLSLTLDSRQKAEAFQGWPKASVDGATVKLTVRDIASDLNQLLSQVAATGAAIIDLQFHSPTLQAVFIHLTGRELRD